MCAFGIVYYVVKGMQCWLLCAGAVVVVCRRSPWEFTAPLLSNFGPRLADCPLIQDTVTQETVAKLD